MMLTKNEQKILIEMTRLSGRLIEAMTDIKNGLENERAKTELTHKLDLASENFNKVTQMMIKEWEKNE